MKTILLLLMLSASLSAQKTEFVRLDRSIKDKSSHTKSLIFVDNRNDKNPGTITYKGKSVQIKFYNENLKNHIEKLFTDDNKTYGSNDIEIFLEDLYIGDQAWGKFTVARFDIKLSSFLKRGDRYYFIHRINEIYTTIPDDKGNIAKEISEEISHKIITFIKNSYTANVSKEIIPENRINDYDAYLRKNIPALNLPILKDGIYKDYKKFFNQEVTEGFTIEKNKKGRVLRAVKNNEILMPNEIFGYVEDGKAYKSTAVGFIEMPKDEKGFFVNATKNEIYPPKSNSGTIIGAAAGGLVGAAIDSGSNSSGKRITNPNERPRVNIDSLTGAFVFEK